MFTIILKIYKYFMHSCNNKEIQNPTIISNRFVLTINGTTKGITTPSFSI